MKYWKGGNITSMTGNNIFVFGSNPEGRHGMGAAKQAMKFGAVYGIGRGRQGNTYALVTKNLKAGFVEKCTGFIYSKEGKCSVDIGSILDNILELYVDAVSHPHLKYFVAYQADSSNLNGYSSDKMFELFTCVEVPDNIYFHNSFRR